MSGHSKWAQIKHKKAITDAKKGQLFSKIVREITLAARSGGPNPETNLRLRSALERARSLGMPKDNTDRALARASGAAIVEQLQEFLYEATAPGGILILIEGTTDNKNRTLAEIKHILSKHDARLSAPGSVLWNFDKIGVIEIQTHSWTQNKESLEMAIIESGANDFRPIEDGIILVEAKPPELEMVRKNLKERGAQIKDAGYDFKPKSPISLDGENQDKFTDLLDELSDQDEVQNLYSNLG